MPSSSAAVSAAEVGVVAELAAYDAELSRAKRVGVASSDLDVQDLVAVAIVAVARTVMCQAYDRRMASSRRAMRSSRPGASGREVALAGMRYFLGRECGIGAMSVFRKAELQYLAGGLQLGRIATVGADGTPHVVPVGWIYNAARDTIDIGGRALERSKKFRDIARTGRAAIVIDDLASTDPWRPRGIEIRGRGEAIALPTPLIRIHPERIVSWGLETARSARTVAS
jgi:pyridoxamine 5'-phosphate oxidase family protein